MGKYPLYRPCVNKTGLFLKNIGIPTGQEMTELSTKISATAFLLFRTATASSQRGDLS
ncbi:MAG: hypothetical protein ACFFE8_14580 [Candidatus Heimdallarchaeota archaeon]